MDTDFEIIDQKKLQTLREDTLIQILAVFIQRFGGEVVISSREFEMMEGAQVYIQRVPPEHLVLHLGEEIFILEEEGN